jgi:hypothetical protein
MAVLMSPPMTDEVTARKGKADRTASAANANELDQCLLTLGLVP